MSGETEQRKGRVGALLAKQWLDRTTRVSADLVNPDGVAAKKLTLKKADYKDANAVFSFDLGGRFREGDFVGQNFLAECKKYANSSDLTAHFRAFLAHCYRAVSIDHLMADQFFWIAFAPHGGTKWDKITSSDEVKSAVLHKDLLDINFVPNQVPEESFSAETAELVSDRLWMLILSEKQIDHLTLSKEHHGVIEKFIVDNAKEVEL
ncbi:MULTISPECIES: hypothetical protein [Mycobacteroides]|uniref:hypothetical protein n=1 Tax=Mycobacteroides TaxID=670516 RepID=UPI0009C870E7|nr:MULTISPECIES: hypothetical protein [Mycobacteroides]MBF9315821.1 hypothetical protein [Mycobacteroides chelonae]MDO3140318.1 hypothetical protein [Mycobacteroides abscessus subsp. abscessus]MDO3154222.1 hypothetical protein [Mycobacteroides abscessus subsp. abscessus]SLL16659.1 Uncharacterised protein [Mycobacteroides abscessus subsp. abscessus]